MINTFIQRPGQYRVRAVVCVVGNQYIPRGGWVPAGTPESVIQHLLSVGLIERIDQPEEMDA